MTNILLKMYITYQFKLILFIYSVYIIKIKMKK